jgi:hypothetical protein
MTQVPHGWSVVITHAQALLPSCPLPAPTPTARTLVAAKRPLKQTNKGPARRQENLQGVSNFKKEYQTSRAGDLDSGVHIIF